jgi:mannose-6-phosphate isomerase
VTGATTLTSSEPSFLHLEPRPVLRPWGGRRIARRFGWDDSADCGEWWLASSYPGTETSLRTGALDLAAWLNGPGRARGCPSAADFPVLLKFLDAAERLSLQVHPDDEVARSHGLTNGKTEAWHILDAESDAHVYLGTAPGVTCVQLLDAVEANAPEAEVLTMLNRLPVLPGDTILVEAGTIHAIAGGISLFEVQQNSNATYRIHDWGRGRDVDLTETRDAMRDHAIPDTVRRELTADCWTDLAQTPAFRLSRGQVTHGLELAPEVAFATLTVIAGEGSISSEGGQAELAPGDTLLVLEPVEIRGAGLDVLAVQPGNTRG